jgi:hypothetical protein
MLDQEERWLTYAEVGELLSISAEAARALVRRQKWARRTPNEHNALARVLVPPDRPLARPRPAAAQGMNGGHPGDARGAGELQPAGHDRPGDSPDVPRLAVRALENAVEVLRDQLGTANRRADDDRVRADRLQAELVELRVSERAAADLAEYATGEATDLRTRLDAAEAERGRQHERADQAERRVADKDATIAGLVAEQQAMRQQVETLTDLLKARRSWWPWKRSS